jgi:hypothetical protein
MQNYWASRSTTRHKLQSDSSLLRVHTRPKIRRWLPSAMSEAEMLTSLCKMEWRNKHRNPIDHMGILDVLGCCQEGKRFAYVFRLLDAHFGFLGRGSSINAGLIQHQKQTYCLVFPKAFTAQDLDQLDQSDTIGKPLCNEKRLILEVNLAEKHEPFRGPQCCRQPHGAHCWSSW